MRPEDFDKLAKNEDGRAILTLMTAPDMTDGYLSVVAAGANGRTFEVCKADVPVGGTPPAVRSTAEAEDPERARSFFDSIFGPIFRMTARKGEKAQKETAFEVRLVMPEMWEKLYDAENALHNAIYDVLCNVLITNKRAAIKVALEQYGAYIGTIFDSLPVLSSEQAAELADVVKAENAKAEKVTKAGRKISRANAEKLKAAHVALSELIAIADEGSGAAGEDEEMDIEKMAQAAAESAVKVAKAAGLTGAALVQAATDAYVAVVKAAVQGVPQPAMPSGAVPAQIAQAQSGDMAAKDPVSVFQAAIDGAKAEAAVVRKMAEQNAADITSVLGHLKTLTTAVQKMSAVPAAPQANAAGASETVQKAEPKVFLTIPG